MRCTTDVQLRRLGPIGGAFAPKADRSLQRSNESGPRREGWCLGADSNHRHADFQSAALPTELPRRTVRARKAPSIGEPPGPVQTSAQSSSRPPTPGVLVSAAGDRRSRRRTSAADRRRRSGESRRARCSAPAGLRQIGQARAVGRGAVKRSGLQLRVGRDRARRGYRTAGRPVRPGRLAGGRAASATSGAQRASTRVHRLAASRSIILASRRGQRFGRRPSVGVLQQRGRSGAVAPRQGQVQHAKPRDRPEHHAGHVVGESRTRRVGHGRPVLAPAHQVEHHQSAQPLEPKQAGGVRHGGEIDPRGGPPTVAAARSALIDVDGGQPARGLDREIAAAGRVDAPRRERPPRRRRRRRARSATLHGSRRGEGPQSLRQRRRGAESTGRARG